MILEWKGQLLAPVGRERYHSVSREQVLQLLLIAVYERVSSVGDNLVGYCAN
jgi:hypothetical protein